MTSVPLETGNIVHDVLEAFLRRLQKSDSNIDEKKFFSYARQKLEEYFTRKTFIEVYYKRVESIDIEAAYSRVEICLNNFMQSPIYTWLFMKAMLNKEDWLIEPEGYGETRLNNLKAYCKMDFLFPVDGHIHILDWKTGKKDEYKHKKQLIGYAAAANANFNIPRKDIFPKIVYVHPVFEELEFSISESDFDDFFASVKTQTEEMQSFCANAEKNIPLPITSFPQTPSPGVCRNCNYQELCFPGGYTQPSTETFSGDTL
jgi:CRISPR/Cas system-associated exonuclease Cas4 (RecB family)